MPRGRRTGLPERCDCLDLGGVVAVRKMRRLTCPVGAGLWSSAVRGRFRNVRGVRRSLIGPFRRGVRSRKSLEALSPSSFSCCVAAGVTGVAAPPICSGGVSSVAVASPTLASNACACCWTVLPVTVVLALCWPLGSCNVALSVRGVGKLPWRSGCTCGRLAAAIGCASC